MDREEFLRQFDDDYRDDYEEEQQKKREQDPRRKYSKKQIEEMRKKKKKQLLFRRAGIILALLLVVFLVIVLIVKAVQAMIKPSEANTPTEEAPTEKVDPYPYAAVFNRPEIADDKKTEGHYSSDSSDYYIYNNMALDTFSGDEGSAQSYADTISGFKKRAPDLTVYNMVIPSHIEYALPQRLLDSGSVTTNSQADYINTVYHAYSDDIVPINCYNKLSEHAADYLFFNTDNQITALGGYYAYTAFTEQTNQRTLDLKVCTEHLIDSYEGGLMYTDESVASHPDSIHYWTFPYETYAERTASMDSQPYELPIFYEEEESGALAYGVFLWGDAALFVEHNQDIDGDKKIAVVKENSSNPFVSYLTADYKEVHIIDYRYFTGSIKSYCEKNGITEVLFVNSTLSANNEDALSDLRAIY
ncbi:MAG: hypothetical protein IJJ15_09325 [Ruminococcus sp.]|nr:hypothetical protein [Ruminococcus sp.]